MYFIAQANNAMIFPGLGLGTIVTRARLISDGMFAATAAAIADMVDASQLGAPILPPMERMRDVSIRVAVAVASQALRETCARRSAGRRGRRSQRDVAAALPLHRSHIGSLTPCLTRRSASRSSCASKR